MTSNWRTWREDLGGVGALCALGAAAWLVVLQPSADAEGESQRLQTQTDLTQSEVAMVQTQLRTARADLEALGSQLEHTVPLRPRSEFNRVVADLNTAAIGSGITLDRLVPGEVERLPEITRHRITLAGRGSYAGAVTFLRTIRDAFPDVNVTVVTALSSPGDPSATAVLSFEVAWYAQPERALTPAAQ